MAEYEDYDVSSPGPNSSLTMEDLRNRVSYLVQNLGQARDMVAETASDMNVILDRLDGVANEMKRFKCELKETREKREKQKAKMDQELDNQTERALSQFLRENLRSSTPREDLCLYRKIRKSYPVLEQLGTRSALTQTDYEKDVIFLL
ncbi:uncharacterized protein [Diadema setosum]|uniref:uncharacterized protein n=1 Tax=Diadema setosum TaxID=31175 RepID=UPI003B3A4E3B